ncbi:MAG: hypothetical protein WCR91_05415 [Sphaerochaetaceae bacterium]
MKEDAIQQIRQDVVHKLNDRFGSNYTILKFEISEMTLGGRPAIVLIIKTNYEGRTLRAGAIKRTLNELFDELDKTIEEGKKQVITERVQFQQV